MAFEHSVLHLSLIPDIGPATVQHLIAMCGNDLEQVKTLYTASAVQLCTHFGITPKRAQSIVTGLADPLLLERELQLIEQHDISWMSLYAHEYPPLLRSIHLPPTILYWRGTHPALYTKTIAIVGSRDANRYGQRVIAELVPPLVKSGCTIVSGGALGIDTMAHRETLESGGTTCVVLGSGLLHPYPLHNHALFSKICEQGGTLLSIFPLDTRPLSGNFPARNRVISGLSKGCVIVQAAQKSGARITANFALEQGRIVGAVPGPIDDPLSVGCHELIKQGAILVTGAESLLEEFEYHEQGIRKPDSTLDIQPAQERKTALGRSKEILTGDPLEPVSPSEKLIQLCARPVTLDDLIEATHLGFAELHELLFDLQLAGKITQTFSGLWHARS